MTERMEFCEYGNRCAGCPMIGQPKAVLEALNIAVPKVTEDRRFLMGEAARVTVSAMYEVGFKSRQIPPKQSQAIHKAVERIAVRTTKSGECPIYDTTARENGQDPDSGEGVHEPDS